MSIDNSNGTGQALGATLKIGAHEEGKYAVKYAKSEKDRLRFITNYRLFGAAQVSLLIAGCYALAAIPAATINKVVLSLNAWLTGGNPALAVTVNDPWEATVRIIAWLSVPVGLWIIHYVYLLTVLLQTELSSNPGYCRALLDAAEQNAAVKAYVHAVNASGRALRYFDLAGAHVALEENLKNSRQTARAYAAAEDQAVYAKLREL